MESMVDQVHVVIVVLKETVVSLVPQADQVAQESKEQLEIQDQQVQQANKEIRYKLVDRSIILMEDGNRPE